MIDYVCTWGPAIHGHNHPIVRQAIADALANGTSFGTPNPYEVEIAEQVIAMVPSVEQIRFCNSGTEATMTAIRMARGITGRDKIIKFAGCYHGHADSLLVKAGSGALTLGQPDSAGIPAALAAHTIVMEYNDLAGLAAVFAELGDAIAGIIVEPIPANCGLLLPAPGFLQGLRQLCDQYQALLIFDEVMTGFRLAQGGVQELVGVMPDLTAMGKIIGGGLPVGAVGGKREWMQCLAPVGPVYQAGTLSGNPLAMAAGMAALRLLQEEMPYTRLADAGARIRDALLNAAAAKGIALQVPQIGSMFALFFSESPVTCFRDVMASDSKRFPQLFQYALQHGVYLPPSAFETAFISTAHSNADIDRTLEVLSAAIAAL